MKNGIPPKIQAVVERAIRFHQQEAVHLLQRLIRIPSVNHPPTGDEQAVQKFYADCLKGIGLDPLLFEPDKVPAFKNHPGRLKDHVMKNRPNVIAQVKGTGGGRSLMLLAHADVEVSGDASLWKSGDPFSGKLHNGRIYGRGAGDDKHGMMINALVPQVLRSAGVRLKGDLLIGSVSDEEQGGSNGVVALLAKGYRADASIYVDGCNQALAISNLGGGYGIIHLRVPAPQIDATRLVDFFEKVRQRVAAFKRRRKPMFAAHPHYRKNCYGFGPLDKENSVRLFDIRLATDDATDGACRVWFYLLPGEKPSAFKREFTQFLQPLNRSGNRLNIEWMSRLVLPSEVDQNHPFVHTMKIACRLATRRVPKVTGSLMSDMGFVNQYGGFPCLIFGASRWGQAGMVHQPDECVEIRRVMECLKAVVFGAMEWCGYEMNPQL